MSREDVIIEVIAGERLLRAPPLISLITNEKSDATERSLNPQYRIQGDDGSCWEFDDKTVLQRNILVLGAIGSGKTNAISQIVAQIRAKMTPKDTLIIFDTKGDYLKKFYDFDNKENNIVISAKKEGSYNYKTWNLFEELLVDKADDRQLTAYEITSTFFDEAIRGSNNPFFPKAARDLTIALISILLKDGNPTNETLRKLIFEEGLPKIVTLLEDNKEWSWVKEYLKDKGQTTSFLVELNETMKQILQGPFGEKGDFSIREFVANNNSYEKQQNASKRTLFLVFGVNTSMTLTPVYRAIYDLAIKEALSKPEGSGKTYFLIDEFSLLPQLRYIENGINFGREKGARFIIGTQNMNQVIDAYGEYKGLSILSGVGTVIAFKSYDEPSRNLIATRYGRNLLRVLAMSVRREEGYQSEITWGRVIEDEDISKLEPGVAFLCLPSGPPYIFRFARYSRSSQK